MKKDDLLQLIERKRQELIQVVAIHGFTASKTIMISKELDELLNTYDRNFQIIAYK